MKNHILISGTGRAGTTFLVQLLTALGFDTGFNLETAQVDNVSHAGMEWDIRQTDAPFIVKSPWLCEYLDTVLAEDHFKIKHLIIPVRDLFDAAESRRDVMRRSDSHGHGFLSAAPGGLWGTLEPEMQENVLTERFYKLISTAVKYNIPITFLDFPKIIHEPEYLRQKLIPIFGRYKLRKKRFNNLFLLTSKPQLVNVFS